MWNREINLEEKQRLVLKGTCKKGDWVYGSLITNNGKPLFW